MTWRNTRKKLRETVQKTFGYSATLETTSGNVSGLTVRWHRKQEVVGETDDGFAAFVSDVDKLVFMSSELKGVELDSGQIVVLMAETGLVRFKVDVVYPEDFPNQTCEVLRQ